MLRRKEYIYQFPASFYSGEARLVLEEKGIDYKEHDTHFLQLAADLPRISHRSCHTGIHTADASFQHFASMEKQHLIYGEANGGPKLQGKCEE